MNGASKYLCPSNNDRSKLAVTYSTRPAAITLFLYSVFSLSIFEIHQPKLTPADRKDSEVIWEF